MSTRSFSFIAAPRTAALCIAASLLVLAAARPVRAQLTLDALELHLAPLAGGTTRAFQVRNDGNVALQAQLTVQDWERGLDGANRFLPEGSLPASCRERLRVFPRALRLEPGATAMVRVTLLPDTVDADASCWSVIFVENPATMTQDGRQLTYTMRTGVKVYGEPPAPTRDGAVVDMALADSAATRALRVRFRNAGNVQLQVAGSIEVRRLDNDVVERVVLPAFPVLPGAERDVAGAIPALPKGRYLLLALLDFGGNEIAAGQLEYEVR